MRPGCLTGWRAFSSTSRKGSRATLDPYESGILHVGFARYRFSAKFYLMAMFFVIFDLEAVFVYAWAVSAREAGWPGYVEMLVFLGILLAALAYLWRLGALEWAPKPRKLPGPNGAMPRAGSDDATRINPATPRRKA